MLHESITERLSLKKALSDLLKVTNLDQCPFFLSFYQEKFTKLCASDIEKKEKYRRITALLGLVKDRFYSEKLPLLEEWIKEIPYCENHYTFNDLEGFECLNLSRWNENFDEWDKKFLKESQPTDRKFWRLRHDLIEEFVKLFWDKLRELIGMAEKDLKANKPLRLLIEEVPKYDRSNIGYPLEKKFEKFQADYTKNSNPAVIFALTTLDEIFNGKIKRDKILETLLNLYWEKLIETGKSQEQKDIIQFLREEIMGLIEGEKINK